MYIYIPLCFYLYFFKYISHAPEIRIYIPLCFYLYINPVIQTQTVNEFTFHYASTYTDQGSFKYNHILHLHSTMLLLIPQPPFCSDCLHT